LLSDPKQSERISMPFQCGIITDTFELGINQSYLKIISFFV
jgi:hypothetical protein